MQELDDGSMNQAQSYQQPNKAGSQFATSGPFHLLRIGYKTGGSALHHPAALQTRRLKLNSPRSLSLFNGKFKRDSQFGAVVEY